MLRLHTTVYTLYNLQKFDQQKWTIFMMSILLSLRALDIVIVTISGAACDDNLAFWQLSVLSSPGLSMRCNPEWYV